MKAETVAVPRRNSISSMVNEETANKSWLMKRLYFFYSQKQKMNLNISCVHSYYLWAKVYGLQEWPQHHLKNSHNWKLSENRHTDFRRKLRASTLTLLVEHNIPWYVNKPYIAIANYSIWKWNILLSWLAWNYVRSKWFCLLIPHVPGFYCFRWVFVFWAIICWLVFPFTFVVQVTKKGFAFLWNRQCSNNKFL